jgi:hypothetical protein
MAGVCGITQQPQPEALATLMPFALSPVVNDRDPLGLCPFLHKLDACGIHRAP